MRRRNRVLVAVVAIILSASLIITEYIYTSSPVESRLSIVAEDHQVPSWPEMGLMILCPSKARQMGLCSIDERQLHAKYMVTVSHPPITRNPTVTCKVMLEPELPEPIPRAWVVINITMVDKSSLFTCTHTRIGEDRLEVDLAFIDDPDDVALIAHYHLLVTVDYDEPLLPWMPLLTRRVSGAKIGDLCLLGYDMGKHPAPGTRESENPLGEFPGCDLFWQRQMLGLEPPCETTACQWVGAEADMLSHVTVHVVDGYGKPIPNVTVSLNTTFCCWDGRYATWTGQGFSETTDSDGNATFAWVTPYARYSVMIEGVVLSEVTGPPPTGSTTVTVTLT